jgi:hypothetical protein
MIQEFIQKALLKNEKSGAVLIKDEKLKNDILSGIEINQDVLDKVFNKNALKRKDFTRLEEIIKLDLDTKVAEIEQTPILYDIISEDFKQYDKTTIKNRLLKKEYLYITGKTLYEHLINRKENSLELIRQNRLLLFLDIPYQDWNLADNLSFEKYFRIPTMFYYAVFMRNSDDLISSGKLTFNDKLENVEFSRLDSNFTIKTRFYGKGTEISDFYRFDLEEEKRHLPLVVFLPKTSCKRLKINVINSESPEEGFVSNEAILLKAKDNNDILNILNNQEIRDSSGFELYNSLTINDDENIKIQPKSIIFNVLAGQYICYTIGKHKKQIRTQILIIKNDCTVHISSSALHSETGYAKISDSEKILQIHFHFEEEEYKYRFLLHLENNDIKTGRIQGIVCGINRLNEPFAERVYLTRFDDYSIEPEDYEFGTTKLDQLLEKEPELLSVFLGETNDFSSDFQSLNSIYQSIFLSKQQNIARISGVFDVFSYDQSRMSIRKSVFEIQENGNVLIKVFEKGQTFTGKAEIQEPDILIISINKSILGNNFNGSMISLLDGFDIEGVENFVAFFTGKNEKNELVARRQVFVKSNQKFEQAETALIAVNSKEYDNINSKYQGVALYLTGATNNILRAELTINHSLKRKTDFGQLYFESACYSAANQDKTRALQQLQNAFNHGFKNKELLKKEMDNGDLKMFVDVVDIEGLRVNV